MNWNAHEIRFKSLCIAVSAAHSKRELVNRNFKQLSFGKNSDLKYISLKSQQNCSSQTNYHINIKAKRKVLEGKKLLEVTWANEKIAIKDTLMSTKYRGAKLLQEVE